MATSKLIQHLFAVVALSSSSTSSVTGAMSSFGLSRSQSTSGSSQVCFAVVLMSYCIMGEREVPVAGCIPCILHINQTMYV